MKVKKSLAKKIMRRVLAFYLVMLVLAVGLLCGFFLPELRDNAVNNAENTLQQIGENYEKALNEADGYLNALSVMPEMVRLLQRYQAESSNAVTAELRLYLSNYQSSNPYILYTMVEDVQGHLAGSIYYADQLVKGMIAQNPYYQNVLRNSSSYCSEIMDADTVSSPFFYYSKYMPVNGHSYVFTVCYNAATLLNNNQALMQGSVNAYMIQNRQGETVCYIINSDVTETQMQTALTERRTSDSRGIYLNRKLYEANGTIVAYITYRTLLQEFMTILLIVILLVIAVPTGLYMVMSSVSRRYLNSLRQMVDNINAFSIGDEPPEILHTGDEVETISDEFYHMAQKVNVQAKSIVEKDREQTVSRYKILTTQLDPHFVSNTMNIINILARHGRNEEIVAVNNALLRILRDRLRANKDIYSTVGVEVEMLRQYMLIMDFRYETRVTVNYEISDDVEKAYIPINILQLLVENALLHGLHQEDAVITGNVTVMVYPNQDELVVEVEDDGKGIEPERLELLKQQNFDIHTKAQTHIGLKNIYDRLTYLFEDNFIMDIQSTPQEGTTVVISLPLLFGEG